MNSTSCRTGRRPPFPIEGHGTGPRIGLPSRRRGLIRVLAQKRRLAPVQPVRERLAVVRKQ